MNRPFTSVTCSATITRFDLDQERELRANIGQPETFGEEDLYEDARPCLATLRDMGLRIGIAGNQTARAETILHRLRLPTDLIVTSSGLGAEKPAPEFFEKLASAAGAEPEEAVYVGDRLDNDVLPALAAGMTAVHLRRGPWGYYYSDHPDTQKAHARIRSLSELPSFFSPRTE